MNRQADPLDGILAQAGRGLSPAESARLEAFWRLLLVWNARINLTGARDRDELVGEHLGDALAMASLVPEGSRVVDVGSGGGLPAIPCALLRSDLKMTLVEPRHKRAAFLRTAVREAPLPGLTVVAGRIADVQERFDVAGSRATFPPEEWLAMAPRLAPRVLVFAARREDVVAGPGLSLEGERSYVTAAGHPRWLGMMCST
jgi:16S rRNA (guanine527-N7)-methyltransferase